jgi:SAM-dependent methyltransferase
MPADHFGDRIAPHYDESESEMFTPAAIEPAVAFLAALAGDGAALELGIGTGRLALPLHRRGIRVHGVDLSSAMLAQLAAKPGADQIGVTVGDFATTRVPGAFRLAYLVFNTIMNLTSQDEQAACFATVADHLEPGGFFVIEVGVPDLQRLPFGETIRPFSVTPARLGFDEYAVVTQGLISHHYSIDPLADGRAGLRSIPFRYVWPAELDLMARLAGLRPYERWGGWAREPFTSTSTSHVSVWQK